MPPTLIVERALQEGLVGTLVTRLQRTVAVADQWSPLWEHAAGLLAQLATHSVHRTSASIQDSAAALAQVCWSRGVCPALHLPQVVAGRLAGLAALGEEDRQRHTEELQHLEQLRAILGA